MLCKDASIRNKFLTEIKLTIFKSSLIRYLRKQNCILFMHSQLDLKISISDNVLYNVTNQNMIVTNKSYI